MGKSKIIVVDDEDSEIKLATIILEQAGYKVITCSDGMSAIEKAKKEKPDLILLDIKMPGMDGFQVCETLGLNKETAKIPVIMCTARDDMDSIEQSFEKGAVDYVFKPYKSANLIERIERALKGK